MKVIAVAAISLDGMIAFDHEHQIETSPQDKAYFEKVTREAGTIVTGRRTLDAMKVPLEGRRNVVYTKQEVMLATKPTSELWYTDEPPKELLKKLEGEGVETVAVVGGSEIFTLWNGAGLIDEWHLTICPQFVGGGVPLCTEYLPTQLNRMASEAWESGEVLLVCKRENENG